MQYADNRSSVSGRCSTLVLFKPPERLKLNSIQRDQFESVDKSEPVWYVQLVETRVDETFKYWNNDDDQKRVEYLKERTDLLQTKADS